MPASPNDPHEPFTVPHVPRQAEPETTPGPGGPDTPDPDRTAPHAPAELPGTVVQAGPPTIQRDPSWPDVPGYDITGEIARGGMGVVYAAVDRALNREVAVKTLLPHLSADPRHAEAFDRESRLTALLSHPGVPPIHAVGTLAAGSVEHGSTTQAARPFLAMRLIRGRTLAEVLAGGERRRPELLQIFEQICQTVGYAHSVGLIHRDLKPGNVMVGAFGEVQVMDWGLARSMQKEKGKVQNEGLARGGAGGRSGADDDIDATVEGHAKGTPAYMPPEQARGEWDAVDARADVFSLGGILCTLLTGKPPFAAKTGAEAMQLARRGDLNDVFARLDTCEADAELVSLCKRCLAPNPADRPTDGRAVAGEVAAYRAGVDERARKAESDRAAATAEAREQRKRRRVVQWAAGAIAVVLSLGIVGTAIGLVRADQRRLEADQARDREKERADGEKRERERANRETQEKEQERARAEGAYTKTAAVLDVMVSEVTGESLATQKVITPEQRKFLTEVLTYYKEFAAVGGTDRQTRERTARAALQVGLIEYRLGQKKEGVAAMVRARDEYAGLATEFPTVLDYRVRLAGSHNDLGVLLADLGKRAEAEAEYRNALDIKKKLAGDFPTVLQYWDGLATSHNNLGNLLADLGKRAEAEAEYRNALDIQQKLVADFPTVPKYWDGLATSHNNLGNLLTDLGKRAEAEAEYRKGLDLQKNLAAEFPTVPQYRAELAANHHNLGFLLDGLGRRAEAEAEYRKGLDLQKNLAAEFPTVPAYRSNLARYHHHLGLLLDGLVHEPADGVPSSNVR